MLSGNHCIFIILLNINRKLNNMNTIIEYLTQKSTWRGIITVVTAFGVFLSPEQSEAIIVLGVAAFGAVDVFRNEKK